MWNSLYSQGQFVVNNKTAYLHTKYRNWCLWTLTINKVNIYKMRSLSMNKNNEFSSVSTYLSTAHPFHLFWIIIFLTVFIVSIMMTLFGNTNCKCCCSSVKYQNSVRKKRRVTRHNCRKCSSCIELSQSVGERLSSYNLYKIPTQTQVWWSYKEEM